MIMSWHLDGCAVRLGGCADFLQCFCKLVCYANKQQQYVTMFCPEMSFTGGNKWSLIEAMLVFTCVKCCLNCFSGSDNIMAFNIK